MSKILVFESDRELADELRNQLEGLGGRVRVFQDAHAGLMAATAEPPDLMVVSVELPRMNGFAVCNRVKKDPALRAVPIILLSSASTPETFAQHGALPTRAQGYLHKPIVMNDLLRRIARLVPVGVPSPPPELATSDRSRTDDRPTEASSAPSRPTLPSPLSPSSPERPAHDAAPLEEPGGLHTPDRAAPSRPSTSRPPASPAQMTADRASSPPGSFPSPGRELLALREALNARD
ncbi:MAG: response regulator, partial [Deltaproteobacteria bacterium]|nr:response regulator [Deltaproteobacteria bacterium]